MGKTVKTQNVANPDWMMHEDKGAMLDVERQMYTALAMEQKFKESLSKRDASKLYEIIFHFLNINSLLSDSKLYDMQFKEITGNKHIETFVENMRAETDGPAKQIISNINAAYTRILTEYIEFALNVLADTNITYLDDKNIHYINDEVYVMFNVSACNHYELWKLNFSASAKMGCDMKKLGTFEITGTETDNVKSFIDEYNSTRVTDKIKKSNFVMAICDRAKDSKNVISIIKDTVFLNKIFYGPDQFNPKIVSHIQQVMSEKKTFPFKLILH